jgi:hypothetical protein
MESLKSRYEEAAAGWLRDLDVLVDQAHELALRVGLDTAGVSPLRAQDQQTAFELLDTAGTLDGPNADARDLEAASILRTIAAATGARIKAARLAAAKARSDEFNRRARRPAVEIAAEREERELRQAAHAFQGLYRQTLGFGALPAPESRKPEPDPQDVTRAMIEGGLTGP